jgi:phospholipid/cholesterol/gamma-HCH transport system substrate-binding protein
MQSVMNPVRSPMFWGVATLVMIVVISLGVAYVYVNPPNQKIVTFYTDDAISVNPGDTVRIAGIVVGKVKDLSLEPDQVRVRASVDGSAFVGDQSQIEVRMLTVVGGYYVTINSLGDSPLGARTIPRERVTMPYNLMRTLADAPKVTENVSTRPINESINQLQQGLAGTNSDALTELINAGNAITDALQRQRGQLSRILDVSNEYVQRLNNDRDLIVYLVSKIAILEQTLVLYNGGIGDSLAGLGEVGKRLDPVGVFYMNHRDDFLARVRGVLGEFQAIADRNGVVVRVLRRIRERMEGTLAAQDAFATRPGFGGAPPAPELFATDLCIPLEGNRC